MHDHGNCERCDQIETKHAELVSAWNDGKFEQRALDLELDRDAWKLLAEQLTKAALAHVCSSAVAMGESWLAEYHKLRLAAEWEGSG